MKWTKKDIISIRDFSKEEIDFVLQKSADMERRISQGKASSLMKNKILAILFFEPSTRTRTSFEAAMKLMGGTTVGFDTPEKSSAMKGENLADTARVVEGYADMIVIRHPIEGSARLASEFVSIPVLNGGDGANQHPTQTLLDLYTIKKKFGKIKGLKIAMVGDLKYGRTVHSLTSGLMNYSDISLKFISPPSLKMPNHLLRELRERKIEFQETSKLNLKDCDVVYATRIQKERFPDLQEYEKVKDAYVLDLSLVDQLKKGAIIMHPLPRISEIKPELDNTKFAYYFQQARNGIPVRAALLCLVLGVKF